MVAQRRWAAYDSRRGRDAPFSLAARGMSAPYVISPLGRYSDLGAFITAMSIVAAAIAAHLGFIHVADTAWLDTAAGIAIGVVLGQRQSTNGAGKVAINAQGRIDSMEQQLGIVARPVETPEPEKAP